MYKYKITLILSLTTVESPFRAEHTPDFSITGFIKQKFSLYLMQKSCY